MNSRKGPRLRHYFGGALIAFGLSMLVATIFNIYVDFKTAPAPVTIIAFLFPYILGGCAAGFLVIRKAVNKLAMVGLKIAVLSFIFIMIPNIILLQSLGGGLRALSGLLLGAYFGIILRVKVLKK